MSESGSNGRQAYVRLIGPAVVDLERLARSHPQVVRWALKKMLLLERNPQAGAPLLGDLIGWRKLTVGDRAWRIIWRETSADDGARLLEIAEVWAVGARGESAVYREMSARVRSLADDPETTALAEVITRLGRLASGVATHPEPLDDPVPEWLRDRLRRRAKLSDDEIDRFSGATAMAAWEDFLSR